MVSGLGEKRLKRFPVAWALATALVFAAAPPAAAQSAPLLAGALRDESGLPVPGAALTAFGSDGAVVGRGRPARDGTFAFALRAPAASLQARCAFCRPQTVAVDGEDPVVIIVHRYAAPAQVSPSSRDYQALPYTAAADILLMQPLTLPARAGGAVTAVSDRGLNAGIGLLRDAGAPAYDRANTSMNLWAFPAYSLRDLAFAPAATAFRYGEYAAGGTFDAVTLDGGARSAAVEAGAVNAARFAAALPHAALAFSSSQADGPDVAGGAARSDIARADARAVIRAGDGTIAVAGSLARSATSTQNGGGAAWGARALSATYAHAAGRTLTEAALTFDGGNETAVRGGAELHAWSGTGLELRSAREGRISTDAGLALRRSRAYLDRAPPYDAFNPETLTEERAYVHARAGTEFLRVDGSLAVLAYATPVDRLSAITPAVALAAHIAPGLRLSAAATSSVQAVPLAQRAGPLANGPGLLRNGLLEGELEWTDSARLRVAACAFSEREGGGARRWGGYGIVLAYQIAPAIALRGWALRGSAALAGSPGAPYAGSIYYLSAAGIPIAREVGWLTYDRGGLRVDAIFRREGYAFGTTLRALDGALSLPLGRGLRLSVATIYEAQRRRYEFGLRR